MGTPEDEEALRQMQEAPTLTDRRSDGDAEWLANGARVVLHSLQASPTLNGIPGRVVGFNDANRRYRVEVETDGTVKQIAKKNLRLLPLGASVLPSQAAPADFAPIGAVSPPSSTPAAPSPAVPPAPQATSASPAVSAFPAAPSPQATNQPVAVWMPGPGGPSTHTLVPLQRAADGTNPNAAVTTLALGPRPDLPPPPPSRDMVRAAITKLQRDTAALQQQMFWRQSGIQVEMEPITDTFLRLNMAFDTYQELVDRYTAVFGEDQELLDEADRAVDTFAAADEQYRATRSWAEFAQDEWNYTHYSIKRHGVLKTLRKEVVEVGRDVAQVGRDVAEIGSTATEVATGVVSQASVHMPRIVRHATGVVGGAVQTGSVAISSATGTMVQRGQRQAMTAIEEQIVGPVKRAWHLLVTGFMLCFIVPLFALRSYAPLNSVVSNLGLVYMFWCVCCPPRFARRRAARAGLLLLWPLLLVVLPLATHYWLLHPSLPHWTPPQLPQLPQRWTLPQLGRPQQGQQACRGGDCGPSGREPPAPAPAPPSQAEGEAPPARAADPVPVPPKAAGDAPPPPKGGLLELLAKPFQTILGAGRRDRGAPTASVPWTLASPHELRRRTSRRQSLRGPDFSRAEV